MKMRLAAHRAAGKKPLPEAAKAIPVESEYAILKFRGRNKAYKAQGHLVEFKVINYGMLNAQVQVHLRLEGRDEKSGKRQTVDVDFYLPIAAFRQVSKLLQKVRFKRDRYRVLRAKRG